jgi:hypothetical protein
MEKSIMDFSMMGFATIIIPHIHRVGSVVRGAGGNTSSVRMGALGHVPNNKI